MFFEFSRQTWHGHEFTTLPRPWWRCSGFWPWLPRRGGSTHRCESRNQQQLFKYIIADHMCDFLPMTDPWCWYINANIKGLYWWDPWHTIYSTMDPSWVWDIPYSQQPGFQDNGPLSHIWVGFQGFRQDVTKPAVSSTNRYLWNPITLDIIGWICGYPLVN